MKSIKWYEWLYSVSEDWNIWSHPKNWIWGHKWMFMKQTYNYWYAHVGLRKNGKTTLTRVHRIIAEAFIPNPENKSQINHKNWVRDDNRIENLEWCTNSENTLHAFRVLGRINAQRKPIAQYSLSGELIKEYISIVYAGKANNINSAFLGIKIKLGKPCRWFIFKRI